MSDALVNATGIIISFCFAAFSLRSETKTRRISNLLSLTQSHRELWTALIQRPELKRILDPAVNLSKEPITLEEQIQVSLIILHLSSAFEAIKNPDFSLVCMGRSEDRSAGLVCFGLCFKF